MRFRVQTYCAGDSPIHTCDARAKIVALLLFSIGILLVNSWLGMVVYAGAVVAAVVVSRVPIGTMNRMLVPVYILAAFSVLFSVLAYPSVQSALAGLFFGLRMIVLVSASFIVCLTSTSSELLAAFRWFIGPLGDSDIPVNDIAFTLALSLRFIPMIESEFETVRAAQKSRGAELSGSFTNKLHIWGAVFSAVFVGMFRRAGNLATAMDARCYGMRK